MSKFAGRLFLVLISIFFVWLYWSCLNTCDELGCLACLIILSIFILWVVILFIFIIIDIIKNKRNKWLEILIFLANAMLLTWQYLFFISSDTKGATVLGVVGIGILIIILFIDIVRLLINFYGFLEKFLRKKNKA